MPLLSKTKSWIRSQWQRLPHWLQKLISYATLFGVCYGLIKTVDSFVSLFDFAGAGAGFLLATLVLITGFFIVSTIVTLRTKEPRELLQEADASAMQQRKHLRYGLYGLALITPLAVLATMWLALSMTGQPSAGKLAASAGQIGGSIVALTLGAPLAVIAVVYAAGKLLQPLSLRTDFVLQVAAMRPDVWAARTSVERMNEYGEGYRSVTRTDAAPVETWRLEAPFPARWLFFPGMVLKLTSRQQDTSLGTDARTDAGDHEVMHLTFHADGAATEIRGTSHADMHSPIMKVLMKIAGPAHMANGAAETEARRYRKLLGASAEVVSVSFETGVTGKIPSSSSTPA